MMHARLGGGFLGEVGKQPGHRIERCCMLADVIDTGELSRIVVADHGHAAAVPEENAEREFDPDPRVVLHQRRAGARIAERDHRLGGQIHVYLLGGSRVVELREYGQTAGRDRIEQFAQGLRMPLRAGAREHVGIVAGSGRSRRPEPVGPAGRSCRLRVDEVAGQTPVAGAHVGALSLGAGDDADRADGDHGQDHEDEERAVGGRGDVEMSELYQLGRRLTELAYQGMGNRS